MFPVQGRDPTSQIRKAIEAASEVDLDALTQFIAEARAGHVESPEQPGEPDTMVPRLRALDCLANFRLALEAIPTP